MARMVNAQPRTSRFAKSNAQSNPNPSGISQGTPGGVRMSVSGRGAKASVAGPQIYLWILVAIELFVMGSLRQKFRGHHGG